jgi:DNA modification methylase
MRIINGDSLEVLRTLPDESVDCAITSPPYWALRDYGCEGQLGLEPTFQEYIEKLCNIFDEVKRVLKKEGTCWVNIGDTYNGNKDGKTDNKVCDYLKNTTTNLHKKKGDLPDKCLCQIPSRFAIEMTNRGWILRNEIIWHKPNCMPSSAEDRFTVDFEKVFFFVKSKKYYFEQILEPYTAPLDRWGGDNLKADNESEWDKGTGQSTYRTRNMRPNEEGRNKRTVWSITTKGFSEAHFATYPEALVEPMIKSGCPMGGIVLDPFSGSGTTGRVAIDNGRDYIGIELNPEYIKIQEKRLMQTSVWEAI